MSQSATTIKDAENLGLLPEEYRKIEELLGRTPNFTELCAYSGMWSEHCSYKNSIKWLKKLPKTGPHIMAEAGEENAGLVDIGDGLACAFKIESHNHPSAIEPFQGAATGVGGINRDIFTMGARPIAQLNSLRFGELQNDKTKWLLSGVVKGIGSYGNSFGIPTVGGEVFFDDSFQQNPLVNAMSVGIVEIGKTVSATAHGQGNPVYIVGSATGKDGIGGAAFASGDITEDSAKDIPSVQVGDPFQEKLLLEASLEIIATNAIIGMQDMGAAGIICSCAEMSAKGNAGMNIDLSKVPTRQTGMQPFELLLSESQERMLVVVKKGQENTIEAIFEKWDLPCEKIGEVTNEEQLQFYYNDEIVAKIPPKSLVLGGDAPQYERESQPPHYLKKIQDFDCNHIADATNLQGIAKQLIQLPNIASKNWVYKQYDSMVGTVNMTTNKPSDAAIVKIKNTNKALAITVDCNSRYVFANPEIGTAIAVCEAARNISCSGGIPSAITNCLNFGNPYNPQAYWQFTSAIKGMIKACEKLKTPVTGGNVSFYNQYKEKDKTFPVMPTPTIGMIGILDSTSRQTGLAFQSADNAIVLLGKVVNDIASSEYIYNILDVQFSPAPYFNIDEELRLHQLIQNIITKKLATSIHDISDGGLLTALFESSFPNKIGFSTSQPAVFRAIRKDAFWLGEAQGRAICEVKQENVEQLQNLANAANVPCNIIGHTINNGIYIEKESWGNIAAWEQLYTRAIEKQLN